MERTTKNLGIYEVTLGGQDFVLKPVVGEKIKLYKVLFKVKETQNQEMLLDHINDLFVRMIKKDYPDFEEVGYFVENNINECIEKIMIDWGITSKEKMEEVGDQLKKQIIQ